MNYPETVQFQFDSQGVDWLDLLQLFKVANLGGREGDKVQRAFEKSNVVCFAKDKMRLVAAGRALSDGEYHATIYDVVVDPEYQRRGVGSRVMSELLARLPVWRVLLVADREVQPFYRRLGFDDHGIYCFAGVRAEPINLVVPRRASKGSCLKIFQIRRTLSF